MAQKSRPHASVKRGQYDAASLRAALTEFENEFGISSEDFYSRYSAGEKFEFPRSVQSFWAGVIEEAQSMDGSQAVEAGTPSVLDRAGRAAAVPVAAASA